jgi:predicted dehydrogenase
VGIHVGIAGVGAFGAVFVQLFRDHPLLDQVAICDINADNLNSAAKRFEINETYSSFDELCQAKLDAIVIFTQPWLHAPQAIQALESGKYVFSAVPMMMLPDGDEMLEWCDKIIQTCQKTGKHYMMGETSYYQPDAMYCRRKAAEGAFGEFVLAEGEYFHDIDDPHCSLRGVSRQRWGDKWNISKSGDTPMYYPTHSIGGFLSVMPNTHITKVSAVGYVYPDDDWFRDDTIWGTKFSNETALCKLSNGAVARVCEYRRIGHDEREAFRLFGTEGSFTDASGEYHWVTKRGKTAVSVSEMRDPLPDDVIKAFRTEKFPDIDIYGHHGGSHPYLVHEFVDAVASQRTPAINAWISARFFAPGIMAHKSAMKEGQWLDVPDWGNPPK